MSDITPFFPENLEDYAPWVATYGLLAPYGECQCCCGQLAPISTFTKMDKGRVKGMPVRYLPSHSKHKLTLDDAFWQYIVRGEPNVCWEWQGARFSFGYGSLYHRRIRTPAHRVSYELHYGPILDGMFVCHKCDNPPCVNPNHLFLGTHQDNMDDMVAKGRLKPRTGKPNPTKLAFANIAEIYLLRESGLLHREIANIYGVSRATIGNVLQGKYDKLLLQLEVTE